MTPVVVPPTVFVSYAHDDHEYLASLETHLQGLENLGVVDVWSDRKIAPGEDWQHEISTAVEEATVAILLITPAFLKSSFVAEVELPSLLAEAKNRGLKILQVIVRPSIWELSPELNKFQTVNSPSSPVSELSEADQDRVWVETALAIAESTRRPLGPTCLGQTAPVFDASFDGQEDDSSARLQGVMPKSQVGLIGSLLDDLLGLLHQTPLGGRPLAAGLRALATVAGFTGLHLTAGGSDAFLDERVGTIDSPSVPGWMNGRAPEPHGTAVNALVLRSDCQRWLVIKSEPRNPHWSLILEGGPDPSRFSTDIGVIAIHAYVEGLLNPSYDLIDPADYATAAAITTLDVAHQRMSALPSSVHRERRRLLEVQLSALSFEFQPVVRLGPKPHIDSYEALARDPATGQVPARVFDSVERWDLMTELDIKVLAIALEHFERATNAVRRNRVDDNCRLSVNIYGPSLFKEEFWSNARCLLGGQFSRFESSLTIEFSEKVPLELHGRKMRDELQRLMAGLALPISIDDFGAGYASIALLSSLRPDFVKIDSSILHGPTEEGELCLDFVVKSTALRGWSPRVIAEGLDDSCQWSAHDLYNRGVQLVQGFGLFRPSPTLERMSSEQSARLACTSLSF